MRNERENQIMSFAPSTEINFTLGSFREKEFGNIFEFSGHSGNPDYPHRVFVDGGLSWRYAKVLKTVAYVIVDEDDGGFVVQKWFTKNYRSYERNV